MKLIFGILLIMTLGSVAYSQTLSGKERGERASLSFRLANYTNETAKTLPVTMSADVESFAKLNLTEKNDLELVKNVLKTLIILEAPEDEGGDRSRDLLDVMGTTFKKHKDIFLKAMTAIETPKNKKQLQEFREILSRTSPSN
jgi:hypothetical protein